MKTRTFATSLAFFAMTSGCGSFAEDPPKPTTLATVQGKLNNASSAELPANIGVALTWWVNGDDYKTAVDLPLTPKFPMRYEIDILEPPPPDTIYKTTEKDSPFAGLQVGVAAGYVVAYADGNHNGHLDLASPTDETASDTMVASNRADVIVYIEGSDADIATASARWQAKPGYSGPLNRGFNLVHYSKDTDEGRVLGQSPMVVDLEVDQDFGEAICARGRRTNDNVITESDHTGRPEHYPSPGDPMLACDDSGSTYGYEVCVTTSAEACTASRDCDEQTWHRPDPVPADWPCPDLTTQPAQ